MKREYFLFSPQIRSIHSCFLFRVLPFEFGFVVNHRPFDSFWRISEGFKKRSLSQSCDYFLFVIGSCVSLYISTKSTDPYQ